MTALELPHINVLSKVDLLTSKDALERFLDPPIDELVQEIAMGDPDTRRAKLTEAIGTLLNEYGMVNFLGLDPNDEDSVELILASVDHAIQYHEDVEPREPDDEVGEDADGRGMGGGEDALDAFARGAY